ncbi:MAG: Jag N-terminal domain-containing protein [Elusimicrobiaceae bacterium]|nr:Jag N-terminal domain-containing protein [Elusimicrobiaceae bacterium]
MLNKVKVQGKTISEAISKGLKELHLRRDQVEVSVLEHPKKGFLGFGSKPAVVEVTKKRWASDSLDSEIYMDVPKRRRGGRNGKRGMKGGRRNSRRNNRRAGDAEMTREPRVRTPKANEPQLLPSEAIQHAVIPEKLQEPMKLAKSYVTDVLTHMGIKAENINVWWDEKQQRILVTFDCDKPAIVIGKEGKTLEAIQYLSTLAVTRQFDMPISVVTDTQNYWRKAEDKIEADIARGIDMIKNGASVFRFRPMSSQLRRYIHRAVEGNEYVQTASEGEGKWRKVTFRPTPKATEQAKAGVAPADFVPGVIGEDIPQEQPAAATQQPAEQAPATDPAQPTQTETSEPLQLEETPTQKIATNSVAETVSHTVVNTQDHAVEEHSVVVGTETENK